MLNDGINDGINNGISWLVVGNMIFSTHIYIYIYIYWLIENNDPNWRTHIFQRGRYTTNQYVWY